MAKILNMLTSLIPTLRQRRLDVMTIVKKVWSKSWPAIAVVLVVVVSLGLASFVSMSTPSPRPPHHHKPAVIVPVVSPPSFPVYWNFPAPAGLTAYSISNAGFRLKWNPVTGPDGEKPTGYTVATYDSGGRLVNRFVSVTTYTSQYGPGGKGLTNDKYITKVWANGGELNTPGVASVITVIWYSVGEDIAAYAQEFLGVPYAWGGMSPSGFDCSGLAAYVYTHFGYYLPHSAESQYLMFRHIYLSQLEPGDLVFYHYTSSWYVYHVAIFIGNGRVIAATDGHVEILPLPGGYVTYGTILH